MAALDVRLRVPSPGLLTLPWQRPLAEWDPTTVPMRDIPVGFNRHLVRFVETDGRLWALKALPRRIALHEYAALRSLEERALPSVRPAGIIVQPTDDDAVLVTEFLDGSWQYRRLLLRVPVTQRAHRLRLFDAMTALLVDLHRAGVHWGDCSLGNTLFKRDGQVIQAWMVDAETTEVHPALSDGQRQLDLDILVENFTGGLLDVAATRGELPGAIDQIVSEVEGIVECYHRLWELLHDEPVIELGDRLPIEERLHKLNELGFRVDEVHLAGEEGEQVRMSVGVAGRHFHRDQLRALTGLDVGEGQARILLADLRGRRGDEPGDERVAARRWLDEVLEPGMHRAHEAVGGLGSPVQAYCDLLEVRWLLSEQAGADIGDGPALDALARRTTPGDSAANLAFVDQPTTELPAVAGDEVAGD